MSSKRIFLVYLCIAVLCICIVLGFFLFHKNNSPNGSTHEVREEESGKEVKNITLDSLFSEDKSWISQLPKKDVRTVIATGDVLLARTVNFKNTQSGNFHWPFEKTAEDLKQADITFINLETPLVSDCPLSNEGFTFCGDFRNIEGLTFAGVDVVNIANNHAGNFGREGVDQTVTILEKNGFVVSGVDGPVYIDSSGITFAFLGYNEVDNQPGVTKAEDSIIKEEIEKAKQNADVVIVQFHWGNEYTTSISDSQKRLGRLAIDSGAELVIGNHPHWIQPVEVYKDKLITYAHGNFIFDQEWSQETKTGIVGKYTFYKNRLVDATFLPVGIIDYGQAYFLEGSEKKKVIESLRLESENFPLR